MFTGNYGPFETILAIREYLDSHSESIKSNIKSKKQYETHIVSLLDRLLKDVSFREDFIGTKGNIEVTIDREGRVIR